MNYQKEGTAKLYNPVLSSLTPMFKALNTTTNSYGFIVHVEKSNYYKQNWLIWWLLTVPTSYLSEALSTISKFGCLGAHS